MNNLTYSFSNCHVLVTGGAQGIGQEISRNFLQAGAYVTIWDYADQALSQCEKDLIEYRSRLSLMQVNVAESESCQNAAGKLAQSLNVLINNAGITRDKSLAKMNENEFRSVIDTNLTGVFNVTKSLLEKFAEDASAIRRIINISSIVALYGNFGQSNYVAAKAGVIGLSKTWARELGKKGFTSNAIAPGFIRTAMTEKMPTDVLNSIIDKIPAKRMGSTQDIASACLFLASHEASYINGTVLSIDGGLVQ